MSVRDLKRISQKGWVRTSLLIAIVPLILIFAVVWPAHDAEALCSHGLGDGHNCEELGAPDLCEGLPIYDPWDNEHDIEEDDIVAGFLVNEDYLPSINVCPDELIITPEIAALPKVIFTREYTSCVNGMPFPDTETVELSYSWTVDVMVNGINLNTDPSMLVGGGASIELVLDGDLRHVDESKNLDVEMHYAKTLGAYSIGNKPDDVSSTAVVLTPSRIPVGDNVTFLATPRLPSSTPGVSWQYKYRYSQNDAWGSWQSGASGVNATMPLGSPGQYSFRAMTTPCGYEHPISSMVTAIGVSSITAVDTVVPI